LGADAEMIGYDIEHRIEIANWVIGLALIVLAVVTVAVLRWLYKRRAK
jgi:ABC-type spermidine/putrescine transport system permease subunit I